MAKIILEYDSDTKDCSVKVDGKKLSDVENLSYCEFGLTIVQCKVDEKTGIKSHIQTMASDGKIVEKLLVNEDIIKYYKKNN